MGVFSLEGNSRTSGRRGVYTGNLGDASDGGSRGNSATVVQCRVSLCETKTTKLLQKTAENPMNWWVAELNLGLYDGKAVLNVTLWAEKPGKD